MKITITEHKEPVHLTLSETVKMRHIDQVDKALKEYEKKYGPPTETVQLGYNLAILVEAVNDVPVGEGTVYDFDRFYNDLDWDPEVMDTIATALSSLFRSENIT